MFEYRLNILHLKTLIAVLNEVKFVYNEEMLFNKYPMQLSIINV